MSNEREKAARFIVIVSVVAVFVVFFVMPTIMIVAKHWFDWLDKRLGV